MTAVIVTTSPSSGSAGVQRSDSTNRSGRLSPTMMVSVAVVEAPKSSVTVRVTVYLPGAV